MRVIIEKLDARFPVTRVIPIYEREAPGEITDQWAENIAEVIGQEIEGTEFPATSTASEIVYRVVIRP